MVVIIMAHLETIKSTEREFMFTQMEIDILVNGKMEKKMAKVHTFEMKIT